MALCAQPKHEVRAVWLTTIGGIDWPATYAHDGMGIEEQQRQLRQMLDQLQQAGVNTVLLQTRVRATTIYPSRLEPWDGCLSGRPGTSPGYDALQLAIDECHRRGMELHAWVVTIPVGKWLSYGCQQLRRRHPSMVVRIGDEGYLNPDSYQTGDYLADICEEITRRYDVDGIHLDYIRYPETWRGRKQRDNITAIVRAIHHRIKLYKPWVKLSCSPIGKYADLSRYRSNGWNARDRVAQDAQGWMAEGLMDQLYPMLYFQGNQFYPFAIDWVEHSCGRTVVNGLAVYMLDPREGRFQLPEVKRQLNVSRQIGAGHCYFRAKFLLDNHKGVLDYATWFDRQPALVPPMTWAQSLAPDAPTRLDVRHTAQGDRLSWAGARDNSDGPYLLYNIYASHTFPVDTSDPANLLTIRYQGQSLPVPATVASAAPLHYAVTAVDRYGNESAPIQEPSPYLPSPSALQGHSSAPALLPNDGQWLFLDFADAFQSDYVAFYSLAGNILHTARYSEQVDISLLPDGIYQLKSLSRKGVTHRIGYFVIKRS